MDRIYVLHNCLVLEASLDNKHIWQKFSLIHSLAAGLSTIYFFLWVLFYYTECVTDLD